MKQMEKERHTRVRKKGIELISKRLISKGKENSREKKKTRIGDIEGITLDQYTG